MKSTTNQSEQINLIYQTKEEWENNPNKRVSFLGMSGLGKTRLSNMLQTKFQWFHYSVDYRIGTRYLGEHIVDNFKKEAMKNPFLRSLLLSDSIYIASNLSFNNLFMLSVKGKKASDAQTNLLYLKNCLYFIIAIFVESTLLICPAPIPRVCLLLAKTIALDFTCLATL